MYLCEVYTKTIDIPIKNTINACNKNILISIGCF